MTARSPGPTLAAVNRISLPLVILLGCATVGLSWWIHTRRYDFLEPPSAAELEAAKRGATRNLARPADLFAVPQAPDDPGGSPEPDESARDDALAEPPRIQFNTLGDPPPLDAWTDFSGFPASSYIDLASRLETDTRFPEALVAWERVIDHAEADADEREAALNGIRRLRDSLDAAGLPEIDPTAVTLAVEAPADRVELTRRAAAEAADMLRQATAGQLRFEPEVDPGDADPPRIRVAFRHASGGASALIETAAPDTENGLRRAILEAAFNSVSSTLAVEESLRPISLAEPGENPADSLTLRVTRRAWKSFANSLSEG